MQHETEQHETPAPRTGLRRLVPGGRTRAVVIGTGILAFGVAPLTYAATGGSLTLGERNSADKETQIIAKTDAAPGAKGGYATRQSNLSTTGGAAIYGCRSTAKTSATDEKNACLRVNNLANGLAFEIRAGKGNVGGDISVANGGDGTKPFTTNATGVATGLNADRVDGKNADQIVQEAVDKAVADAVAKSKPRWVTINARGEIEAQSGGFTVKSGYVGNPAGATDNVYIDAGEDLTNKGILATIALQNQTNQVPGNTTPPNGRRAGEDVNPEFSGEISATRCAITGVVACAPAGTNTNTHFVVSPRMSDGSATSPDTRKRFTVTING